MPSYPHIGMQTWIGCQAIALIRLSAPIFLAWLTNRGATWWGTFLIAVGRQSVFAAEIL